MSIVKKCDVKGFEGTVTLPDGLTLPEYSRFVEASNRAFKIYRDTGQMPQLMQAALPGMIPLVEKWDLKNMPEKPTAETWPGTPPLQSMLLYNWLYEAIMDTYGIRQAAEANDQAPEPPQDIEASDEERANVETGPES